MAWSDYISAETEAYLRGNVRCDALIASADAKAAVRGIVECVSVEAGRAAITAGGEPEEEWTRGTCPQCGAPLVSNCYYVGGRGYMVIWDCWASLGTAPTCKYRKVL